jgi:lysine 2-monooxygenase
LKDADLTVSVAIVGGGCAGAYCALRLQGQLPRDSSIALFEYSDRIGGRLYTRTLPYMPHVNAEVGGMRYIPWNAKTGGGHKMVNAIIDELKLETREFPMGNSDPKIGPNNNYVFLRRQHLLYGELSDSTKVPYRVDWPERNLNPDQLQTFAYQYLVPEAVKRDLSLDELFDVKCFGKYLYEYGLWDLLYLVLSSEAYSYMLDAGGYDTNVANANAVSALPSDDFTAGTIYRTITRGYDQMPIQAVKTFNDKGGAVYMQHRLLAIERNGERSRLTFERIRTEENPDSILRTFHRTATQVTVDAEQVILAMPRRSLELIDWAPLRDERVEPVVNSVIKQVAFKLFLGYEYPWWKSLGLEAGRSITDMPLRQIYYFGTEEDSPGGEPGNTNSLMMASYNDLRSVPFWKAFENDPPFPGYRPQSNGGLDIPPVPRQHLPATTGMVNMAQLMIREIHGTRSIPAPYSAAYHDWSEDPFGAGWHAWKAGIDFRRMMKAIRHPADDWRVYVCGEAYSVNQGWVEGAYQTAEHVLQDSFRLKPPPWLGDYDLGP